MTKLTPTLISLDKDAREIAKKIGHKLPEKLTDEALDELMYSIEEIAKKPVWKKRNADILKFYNDALDYIEANS